ncbi:hypothetical protein TrRE_jg13109 [Triparma retinervis]|uniref:WW domain-containing protein n=1 Tax=Triparma retinervis TaxID=2557542 RepID=A0A9W7EHL8_9STRA|nr:hypothetical protein TrRE_jg13109 [Triparma retinervis]
MPFYASFCLATLSLCCCVLASCVKAFSKTNKMERSAKKHANLVKKRSTKKEFELPSTFGGLRDSEFSSGANPMREADVPRPEVGGRVVRGLSAWEMFVDEETGSNYYVNNHTGETSWDPPSSWQ